MKVLETTRARLDPPQRFGFEKHIPERFSTGGGGFRHTHATP